MKNGDILRIIMNCEQLQSDLLNKINVTIETGYLYAIDMKEVLKPLLKRKYRRMLK
jgi:hypothetical protein